MTYNRHKPDNKKKIEKLQSSEQDVKFSGMIEKLIKTGKTFEQATVMILKPYTFKQYGELSEYNKKRILDTYK